MRQEEDICRHSESRSKSGERLRRRPADGLDGSRRGQSHSFGNCMSRRGVELQSDTRRPRQRHPSSASLRGGGEGGEGEAEEGGRPVQETEAWVWAGERGRPAQETEVWVWPSSS